MSPENAPAAQRQPHDAKTPDNPTELHGGGWWATAKRAFAEFRADDMMTWAAALTYYAVLSLFPALIALVSLIGVFGKQPDTTDSLLNIIGSIGPQSTVDALRPMIENLVANKTGAGALLSFGLIVAIWSASGYIGAFFKASNAIYEVDEGRGFFKLRPLQLGLTVLFLLVVGFGLIVFVASGSIVESVADVVGLGGTAVTIWTYAKWPILALGVAAMFALLYWAAPNVKQPSFKWMTPGGLIGLVVLVIASAAFAFYVTNFNSAGETYGALAAVPIGLTWLWICNLALLFGAEFDAELERQRRIEGGMRPVDAEPFLPHRSEPKDVKDGADLAREQVAEDEVAEREPATAQREDGNGRFERRGDGEAAAGEKADKPRRGGIVGKLTGR
ncbi:MAG TPA: YihY/virulence factor BrkB family protein [Solirubrobacteraceae bacterium]|nr:YihY/virulence factor BrkB family protein [Solirubrobacteraceae bacterium]